MELTGIALISGLVLLGLLVVIGVVHFLGRSVNRRWNSHKAETVDRWVTEGIDFTRGPIAVQFGGLESMGRNVTRGVGYAVLTHAELRVTCALPSTQWWAVLLGQITDVTLKNVFLGKSASQTPFIVVHFKSGDDTDRLGFQVNDTESWATALANAAGVELKRQL